MLVLLLVVGVCTGVRAQEKEAKITKWNGETVEATFSGISEDGSSVVVKNEDGTDQIPIQNLLKIQFTSHSRKSQTSQPVSVHFRSGDRLTGSITEGRGEEGFVLKSPDRDNPVQIDLMKVDAIAFPKNQKEAGSIDRQDVENEDILYKTDGDYYIGFLQSIGNDKITFDDSNLGEKTVKPGDVYEINLTATGETPSTPEGAYMKVFCRNGSIYVGQPAREKKNHLLLKNLMGGTWQVPYGEITTIILKNGRTTFLSDLEPAKVVQEERFIWDTDREPEPLPPRYQYRTDESVPGEPGQTHPIKIHGETYSKGISCIPYTKLTYKLDGKFKKFQSTIGIDDRANHPNYEGSVVFRVYVDGEKIYDSGKTSYSEFPEQIDVKVEGASTLTLEVDLGEGYLDYADWADARLTR